MTFVNGNEITPVEFKEIHDFDTKIILKYIETQEESNGESDDKVQESEEAATDDETTEAANAAEAEDDGEDKAAEASEASAPEARLKPYEVEASRDPLEDL